MERLSNPVTIFNHFLDQYIHKSKSVIFEQIHVFVSSSRPNLGPLEYVCAVRSFLEVEVEGDLRGAEARVGLGASSTGLGVDAGSHGAGNGVAGTGGAL